MVSRHRFNSWAWLGALLATVNIAACDDDSDDSTTSTDDPTQKADSGTTDDDQTDDAKPNGSGDTDSGKPEPDPPAAMFADPSKDAMEVIESIDGYEEWTRFSENVDRMKSGGHAPGGNAMFVETFRNDVVVAAEETGTLPLPDGSLIVKENYPSDAAEDPMALTIMAKMDGEWFWLQMTPDGKVMRGPNGDPVEGTDVPMCVDCHSDVEDNDYVFLHDFSTPTKPSLLEPSEEAQAVIDSYEGYTEWSTFEENATRMQSSGHAPGGNAMFVQTYRNSVVEEAEKDGTLPLPDGSVIVKENYPSADAEDPMALTVMAKTNGEWFWLQVTPSGEVMTDPDGAAMEGFDVPMCVTCHSIVSDNDYVYLHDFSEPLMMSHDAGAADSGMGSDGG